LYLKLALKMEQLFHFLVSHHLMYCKHHLHLQILVLLLKVIFIFLQ
jgi:hypothetical protein